MGRSTRPKLVLLYPCKTREKQVINGFDHTRGRCEVGFA